MSGKTSDKRKRTRGSYSVSNFSNLLKIIKGWHLESNESLFTFVNNLQDPVNLNADAQEDAEILSVVYDLLSQCELDMLYISEHSYRILGLALHKLEDYFGYDQPLPFDTGPIEFLIDRYELSPDIKSGNYSGITVFIDDIKGGLVASLQNLQAIFMPPVSINYNFYLASTLKNLLRTTILLNSFAHIELRHKIVSAKIFKMYEYISRRYVLSGVYEGELEYNITNNYLTDLLDRTKKHTGEL